MKTSTVAIAASVAALVVSLTGCGKKAGVDSALDQAVAALDQPPSEPAMTSAIQPPPPPSTPTTTSAKPALVATTQVAQQMNQAVASYKDGNYEDAVRRLQWLRSQKGQTPEQILALQEATAAVMGQVYALAAKGDARAKLAVKEYERLQNSRQ